MFISLINRALAVTKFVDSGRLVVDSEYKQNVIQYLTEGKTFNVRHLNGSVVISANLNVVPIHNANVKAA